MEDKVRENRLRRMAQRQGLRVIKSRRRDPRALDYGLYELVDEHNHPTGWAWRSDYGATIDELEEYLTK